MAHLTEDKLLKFNPNSRVEIRKMYGFNNAEDLDKAIDILDAWVKKQNHFVKKDFSRDYLECGILFSKGSVELAKGRLEKLCTMRTLMPHYFEDYDFEKDFHFPKVIQVLLPKLTKDHGRIYWATSECDSFTPSSLLNMFRLSIVIAEYTRSRDYVNNFILIYDLRKTNIANFLMSVQVNEVHRLATILLETKIPKDHTIKTNKYYDLTNELTKNSYVVNLYAVEVGARGVPAKSLYNLLKDLGLSRAASGYGARLKSLHLLTPSKLIEGVVALLKQVLNPKLRDRVKVHKDVEELYKFIPKENIPVEYGGEEKSLQKIYAEWVAELNSENFKEHWREMCRACTDESCRQADTFNEQYMGMPGTFRTLSVD